MNRIVGMALLLLCVVPCYVARAATAQESGKLSPELRDKIGNLRKEIDDLQTATNFAGAEARCLELLQAAPSNSAAHLSLARLAALQDKKEEAFAALAKAAELNYEHPGEVEYNVAFANLRGDKRFAAAVEKIRANMLKGSFEKGAELPGIKTIEGWPEGGLRYRVRMSPAATPEKPHRLVLWFHQAGSSGNGSAESLAPTFVKRSFALVVVTAKQFRSWAHEEINMYVGANLAEIGKIPGLSAERPLLFGFSAGAQVALLLWQQDAGRMGGLILDEAAPVDLAVSGGRKPLLRPPGHDAVKTTPLFVLAGGAGKNVKGWELVEESWRKAGVPLTFISVPGCKHEWLFDEERRDALDKWLTMVKAKQ